MAARKQPLTPERQHKRDVFRQITLPMFGMLLIFGLLLLLASMALGPSQFGMVADTAMCLFWLIPGALLCALPAFIMVGLAVGSWQLKVSAKSGLGRLRGSVLKGLGTVRAQVPRAAAPVIALQSRLAFLERAASKPVESLAPGRTPGPQEEE